MSEIWVLVDTTADGKVRNVTYEVLTAAVKPVSYTHLKLPTNREV